MVKILKAICGSGIEDHFPASGWFTVKFETGSKKFNRLADAVAFYHQLDKEAGIWDTTTSAQLLEFKIIADMNTDLQFGDITDSFSLN